MPHTHRWGVHQYVLLSLPDLEGFADRFTQWRCQTCPLFVEIDAHILVGTPLHDPPFWDALDPTSTTRTSRGARQLVRAQRR